MAWMAGWVTVGVYACMVGGTVQVRVCLDPCKPSDLFPQVEQVHEGHQRQQRAVVREVEVHVLLDAYRHTHTHTHTHMYTQMRPAPHTHQRRASRTKHRAP